MVVARQVVQQAAEQGSPMVSAVEVDFDRPIDPATFTPASVKMFYRTPATLGTAPGHCHHCHTGRCPVGITTQDPELTMRLDIDAGAERVANFLNAMTAEIQMLARACGKANVHDLDPEDLRALTVEASLITGIPLVGMREPLRPRGGS